MRYKSLIDAIKTKSINVHEIIDKNCLSELFKSGWVRSHYVTQIGSPWVYAISEYENGEFSEPIRTPYIASIFDD